MKKIFLSVIPASSTVIPAKAGIHFFLLFSFFVLPFSASFATPPVSISLSYDSVKGSLHVGAVHPSFNLDKSYVRLMTISVNDQEVLTKDYYKQNDNYEFNDDVSLTAQAGDVIKVELFCSLGGEMAKELTVTKLSQDSILK